MQKKLDFNKKQRINESLDKGNQTVSCRLNPTQLKLLKIKAAEKNLNVSEFLRQIIIEYLDNEVCHENLVQSSLLKVMDKIDTLESKQEFFQQLFYSWLSNWFYSHPAIEEKDQNIIWKNSVVRRNEFMNKFITNTYNENEELYEVLFANKVEEETDD